MASLEQLKADALGMLRFGGEAVAEVPDRHDSRDEALLLVERATVLIPRSHVTAQIGRVGSKPRAWLENRMR